MSKVSRLWLWLAIFMMGFAGGIVVGVVVDVDQVYQTHIKRIKQRDSPDGTIIMDIEGQPIEMTKKEARKARRIKRKAQRDE